MDHDGDRGRAHVFIHTIASTIQNFYKSTHSCAPCVCMYIYVCSIFICLCPVKLSRAAAWMFKYVEDNFQCVCSATSCLKVCFSTPEILKNSSWSGVLVGTTDWGMCLLNVSASGVMMYCRVAIAVTMQQMWCSNRALLEILFYLFKSASERAALALFLWHVSFTYVWSLCIEAVAENMPVILCDWMGRNKLRQHYIFRQYSWMTKAL